MIIILIITYLSECDFQYYTKMICVLQVEMRKNAKKITHLTCI